MMFCLFHYSLSLSHPHTPKTHTQYKLLSTHISLTKILLTLEAIINLLRPYRNKQLVITLVKETIIVNVSKIYDSPDKYKNLIL